MRVKLFFSYTNVTDFILSSSHQSSFLKLTVKAEIVPHFPAGSSV